MAVIRYYRCPIDINPVDGRCSRIWKYFKGVNNTGHVIVDQKLTWCVTFTAAQDPRSFLPVDADPECVDLLQKRGDLWAADKDTMIAVMKAKNLGSLPVVARDKLIERLQADRVDISRIDGNTSVYDVLQRMARFLEPGVDLSKWGVNVN